MGDKSDGGGRGKPSEFQPAGDPGDDPLTRNLKRVYDSIAAEPIPDQWLKLLEQLDSRTAPERKK
jgi:hypothetical protein